MAVNIDSPKRRSLRLQGESHQNVTPDSRGLEGSSNGLRTSGTRTRLSGGKLNDAGSLRRSKGQKVEEPAGAKGKPSAGSAEVHTSQEDRGQSGDDKSNKKTVKSRRSREDRAGDGRPDRKDGAVTPPVDKQERNDVGEAGCCQEREEKGKKPVVKTEGLPHEVRASSSIVQMERGEKAGPAIERTRTDVEEAGLSGVDSVASGENAGPAKERTRTDVEEAGLSGVDSVASSENAGPAIERTRTDVEEAGLSGMDSVASSENAGPSRGNTNPSRLSPSTRPLCAAKSPDQGTSAAAPLRDSKVRCTSKHLLQEMLGMCAEFSKEILQSQNYLNQEQREQEHRNFMLNFETTFQDNVSINGQSWDEATDTAAEPDIKILEDQLDDAIAETAYKRKRNPQKILRHFVKALKVEREILNHFKPEVEPKELKLDPNSESRMAEQTATTASISRQIKETMKALPAQLEKAEGFSQVLTLQPMLQKSLIRQDIFSSRVILHDVTKTLPEKLETTPRESEPAANIVPTRSTKKRLGSATQSTFYPLRSKRKISLDG